MLKAIMVAGLFVMISVYYLTTAKFAVNDFNKMNGWKNRDLIQHWKRDDVAVLVRHEERCDRSPNPCLRQPDGITVLGSLRAEKAGSQMEQHLGLL